MGPEWLVKEGLECMLKIVGPGLNGGLSMIGLGEQVGDVADEEVAIGQPLVEWVVPKVLVEDIGEVQLPHLTEQQRHIIDPFLLQDKRLWFHDTVLPFPPFQGWTYAK